MGGVAASANEHGNVERLLLSGGGLRAMVGSVGVILYLMRSGRWSSVNEIVSVSGGSAVNAALLTSGGWKNDELTDADRLRIFTEALVADKAWPKTPRRIMVFTLIAALVVGIAVLIVLSAIGTLPSWAAVLIGLAAVPLALQLGRRLVSVYVKDVLRAGLGLRGQDKAFLSVVHAVAKRRGDRQHFFAASGLASNAPYFFWVGGEADVAPQRREGKLNWGYPIRPIGEQNSYTIDDAAFASASLPLVGGIWSPRQATTGDGYLFDVPGGEPLVDGGGSGVFGDQLRSRFTSDPELDMAADAHDPVGTVAVDTFRHPVIATKQTLMGKVFGFVRDKLSVIVHLIGWTKLAGESLYVNDLLDVAENDEITLLRLCESDERFLHGARLVADHETEARLSAMKDQLALLGLFGLSPKEAINGVTAGFVEAYVQMERTTDGLDEALAWADGQLGAAIPGHSLTAWWAPQVSPAKATS